MPKDDWGKMREELVGKGTDYRTTKKIVERKSPEQEAYDRELTLRVRNTPKGGSLPPSRLPGTVGNTPMYTEGSRQPHGYGHSASQRDGALRLSGNPKAHRIGKR